MSLVFGLSRTSRLAAVVWVTLTSFSIALSAADNKDGTFKAPAVSTFANKQKTGAVTLAAEAFSSPEKIKAAFGKVNPYQYGMLPILVVIQNDSNESISLTGMRVEYQAGRLNVEPTPAKEVQFARAPQQQKKPAVINLPGGLGGGSKKNPLAGPEIESRAFGAKMLPPGDSASGFFYFSTDHRSGAILYVTGLRSQPAGKDLFFVEIPLNAPQD